MAHYGPDGVLIVNGKKRQASLTPNDAQVTEWKKKLADLQRRADIFHKAGIESTAWDEQIEELEQLINGAETVPEIENNKGENLEVETNGT